MSDSPILNNSINYLVPLGSTITTGTASGGLGPSVDYNITSTGNLLSPSYYVNTPYTINTVPYNSGLSMTITLGPDIYSIYELVYRTKPESELTSKLFYIAGERDDKKMALKIMAQADKQGLTFFHIKSLSHRGTAKLNNQTLDTQEILL